MVTTYMYGWLSAILFWHESVLVLLEITIALLEREQDTVKQLEN